MTRAKRLGIREPCGNRWQDLEPRDGGRYCAECDRVVVNLRNVTEARARQMLERANGDLCAFVRADADGRAIFREAPRRVAGVGAVALSAALAACSPEDAPAAQPPAEVVPEPVEPPAPPPVEPEAPIVAAEPEPIPEAPEPAPEPRAEQGHHHPRHRGDPHTEDHTEDFGLLGGLEGL